MLKFSTSLALRLFLPFTKNAYGAKRLTTESNWRKMDSDEFPMLNFMLTTEIQQDTKTGSVTLNPRWLGTSSAVKYSGQRDKKKVKSVAVMLLKQHRPNQS